MRYYHFKGIYSSDGWLIPGYVGVDRTGSIQYISDKAPASPEPLEFVDGYALPGFQNAHSHAFARYVNAFMIQKLQSVQKDTTVTTMKSTGPSFPGMTGYKRYNGC